MEGQMIRMHPGYTEKTLGLRMGKANSAFFNFFHAITCKKVFYLGSSLREMKEVAWVGRTGSESITCPIG